MLQEAKDLQNGAINRLLKITNDGLYSNIIIFIKRRARKTKL